ncbi:hypothetical protein [Sphingomonas sp. Ant20]|uniref:hypothetical protein n=1 Tax=Sphingomonas sp. Ant20 TaxID=104605 RepID=UPI000B1CBDFE|nr:hypothetical protein [Sphingomonas sp. Ant20]
MRNLALAISVLAIAKAVPVIAQEQKPLSETCPNLTPEEIEAIENYKGEFSENALYARAYCVSVKEAERQMEIQNRGAIGPRSEPGPRPAPPAPDADIGTLAQTLHANEADTFAGLWIQHQPKYGVVVAFTRDAAETLAKYTNDPLYIPLDRPGPTLTELRSAQERLVRDLSALGINWFGIGGNESTGKIEVSLGQSADTIHKAAARGEIDLPDFVVFKEPDPFPVSAPPVPPGDTRVKSFPQFAMRTDGMPRTLVGVPDVPARLELREGCLWLVPENEEPKIALWQQGDALDLTDPNRVAVLNRFSGARVFADTDVVLMGLQPGEERTPDRLVGTQACPGPYRVVRGIVPREVWDKQRRDAALASRERELGSRAAAEADYAADMARLSDLRMWRTRALADHGDVIASIWINEEQGTAHMYHTDALAKGALVPAALLPFVTAQVVPQGSNALEAARADIAAQIAVAGIEAQIRIEPTGGYVELRPSDLAALSQAAVAGAISFPPLVRVAIDNQNAIYREDIPLRRDPEAIWYPLEAHPDFAAIRALVEKTPIMRSEPSPTNHEKSVVVARKPSKAGSLQQTHWLIASGYTLREIEMLRRAGFDPIEALEDMNGRQTVEKRALTATDIVVAEPIGIDVADPGPDGFASTVRWRVIEVLKGDAEAGEELRQRLASGERADHAGVVRYGQNMDEPVLLPGLPTSLEPGTRWVLHLNDSLYRHASYTQGGERAAREGRWFISVPWMPSSRIAEDGMVRPISLYPEPIALDELREAIAPIQRALGSIHEKGRSLAERQEK